MKVSLLSHTQNPDELVAIAASNCVSGNPLYEICNDLKVNKSKVRKIIETIKKNHHYSVFEHVSFTFAISGVSRVLLAQITRHRIASFSVRSMRYAPINETNTSMFGTTMEEQRIMNNNPSVVSDDSLRTFIEAYLKSSKYYHELISKGVSQENARYVLPNGFKTSIVLTMNARELIHFFGLRCCVHAQSEIRKLAMAMAEIVIQVAPIIFEGLNGPQCEQLGYCPEGNRSCHRYPTLYELQSAYKEVKKDG